MDEQTFFRELQKYPVVRTRDWRRHQGVEGSTPSSISSFLSPISSQHMPTNTQTTLDSKTASTSHIALTSTSFNTNSITASSTSNSCNGSLSSSSSPLSSSNCVEFWQLVEERVREVVNTSSSSQVIVGQLKENYESLVKNLSLDDIELFAFQLLSQSSR